MELPVIDPSRIEFGYSRTKCGCAQCTTLCRYMPGVLIPDDIHRIANHLGAPIDIIGWAKEHFYASGGWKIVVDGTIVRVPSLVPAKKSDGSCIFLTNDGKCSIHEVAPYGCAFFDTHMDGDEGDKRSTTAVRVVMRDHANKGVYSQIILALAEAGKLAEDAQQARDRMSMDPNFR